MVAVSVRRSHPLLTRYQTARRNFWLGVTNGALITGAEAFFHSSLVLAPFLAALGASPLLIGLIPALRVGGFFLPQLLIVSRIAHHPLKLPWYRATSIVRSVAYILMVLAVFTLPEPAWIMTVVLAMIAINAIAGGISGVPFADVTAKIVPHNRLGTFWALRSVIGGVLALLAGLVLRQILAGDIPFPDNFGYLLLIGAVLAILAYLSFTLVREPPGRAGARQPLVTVLSRIPTLLRQDYNFRRYLRVRFIALLALLGEPFYAVYAIKVLGAPASAIGTFVMLSTAAAIAANFLFRRPADQGRNVMVMQISILLLCAAPLLALLAPSWQLFSVVMMLSAAGQSGMGMAAWNLLYAIAPEEDRPLYVGAANTMLTIPTAAPILAGAMITWAGYLSAFAAAGLLAICALALTARFAELRRLDVQALKVTRTRP